MKPRHKTAAWPLALAYAGLIVYASLYPFSGWRDQGVDPLSFLIAPWPRYWSEFDLVSNLLGYAPFGALLALGWRRAGQPALRAALMAGGVAALLSLTLEYLQIFLPSRVPSNLDFALNVAGACLGALLALLLAWRFRLLERWSRVRDAWLAPDARGALVLLALWPCALLYPAALPFGLGQVLQRVMQTLADAFAGTPLLDALAWLDVEPQPLLPAVEALCVGLSVLLPELLACSVIDSLAKRAVAAALVLATGVAATALSAALSWGPQAAWVWLTVPVQGGLLGAALLVLLLARLNARICALLALLALLAALVLLNQAPAGPYFAQTLQSWEQGRFIRFHGVVQWLGWCWPYVALGWLAQRLARRQSRPSLKSAR